MELDDLNWNDHSCYDYSNILDVAAGVTILPNATAEVRSSAKPGAAHPVFWTSAWNHE